MNCKPGDLAVIVGKESFETDVDIGKFVRVVEPFGDGVSWLCEAEGAPIHDPFGIPHQSIGIYDHHLRPIRGDQGNESWFKVAPLEYAKPNKVTA